MYCHTIRTVHRFPVVFVHNTVTHKEDTTKYRRRSFLDLYQKNGHVMLLLFLLLCHPVNFPVVFLLISYLSSHSPSLDSRPHIHLLATAAAAATLEYVCPGFSCRVHSACKRTKGKKEDDIASPSSSSSSKQPSVFTLVVWCVGVEKETGNVREG